MRLFSRHLLIGLLLCALCGCAKMGGPKKTPDKPSTAPADTSGIPSEYPNFHQPPGATAGTPVVGGGNVPARIPVTPDEDIVWTDPDHPDAKPAELETLLEAPQSKTWEESDTEARKQAMRQCKPLLIWFTDSASNALCKTLSNELFSTEPFDKWANDKFVRLRVDANTHRADPKLSMADREDRESRMKDYVEEMKKRYKVLGQPTVLVVAPNGSVIGRYRGYNTGKSEIYWGLIRQGEVAGSKSCAEWRAGMEKKGYRQWQDRRGRKVFAKLLAYAKGDIFLTEPDGQRSRTTESKLSDADRSWLAKEKAARGIR
jgi:thioredoxin-related protein